jgi:flagellar hook assembly protein FlgD
MYEPIEVAVDRAVIPTRYFLEQNFPNPFNPQTYIRYGLPEESDVEIVIFNMRGELVRTLVDTRQPAGEYDLKWDTTSDSGVRLPSGLYFYRLETEYFRAVKKMVLTR